MGNAIDTTVITMLGGYCGGPEGTAITAIAEMLQSYVMARPIGYSTGCTGIRFGSTSKVAVWANSMDITSSSSYRGEPVYGCVFGRHRWLMH